MQSAQHNVAAHSMALWKPGVDARVGSVKGKATPGYAAFQKALRGIDSQFLGGANCLALGISYFQKHQVAEGCEQRRGPNRSTSGREVNPEAFWKVRRVLNRALSVESDLPQGSPAFAGGKGISRQLSAVIY
jgi:hypothetical protein